MQAIGFYLDILKDRLYTAGKNSTARRSAQNALYHITHSLARLIAPILSFTGEEVFEALNGKDDVSVFEGEWYELPENQLDNSGIERWEFIRSLREQTINKEIENLREAGKLGSSLAAELDISATGNSYLAMSHFGDELKYIFIASRATLHQGEEGLQVSIRVTPSAHNKCERCWHYRADVGSDDHHPTICGRCVGNLYGSGEERRYA